MSPLTQEQLRQADLKTKDAIRQKDDKDNAQMDTKIDKKVTVEIDKALRQERHSSELKGIVESVMTESVGERGRNNSLERELKKLIKSEIKEYLISKMRQIENARDRFALLTDQIYVLSRARVIVWSFLHR